MLMGHQDEVVAGAERDRVAAVEPGPTTADAAAAPRWRTSYVRNVVVGDALAGLVAGATAYEVRFGTDAAPAGAQLHSAVLAAALPVVWLAVMAVGRTYEQRFLWVGPDEFRRVFRAAVLLLAVVGSVSWALNLELARGLVVIALPTATLLTLLQRYAQRRRLHRRRIQGNDQQSMLIVGLRGAVEALDREIRRERHHGYRVVGCALPGGRRAAGRASRPGVPPVLGGFDDVVDVVQRHGIDIVAVLPSPQLDGAALRRLGWALEETRAELLLAPAITDVAGPRVHIRPVCGLPLLHMDRPELRGARRVVKGVFDRVGAAALVVAVLPLLVGIAVAVRCTSAGPVLFRQIRVGRDGRPFPMLKFRSMVAGAETMTPLEGEPDDGNGVLFKLHDDPRQTRLGRVLRRYSLDELPQLFNVLRGEMSLVGPRPPLPCEVERYGFDMRRRFLVKPGLTGLWQISGRSDLSWDDSVRADIRYVENWSLMLDFMILWKTVGAVARGGGAY